MNKQDKQGVRSPTDIERKYDLASIPFIKKAVQNNLVGINKTNKILEQFVEATTQNIDEIQKRMDNQIETWFLHGEPKLENEPASGWTIESYAYHVGDLYYDKDTGCVYKFKEENDGYVWEQVQDQDTIEAMARANAAVDTMDSKRRVFVEQPNPPYDNGDLWLNENEIYVCQISKDMGEEYLDGDFIVATKYTDDTLAKQINEELTILTGTVTKIRESADNFEIELEKTVQSVTGQGSDIESLKTMKYRFGTEDLVIEKSGSEMRTEIDEDGMKVYRNGKKVLTANNEGVDAENLHATTYLVVGKNSRFEDYGKNRTGCFWVGNRGE